MLCFCNFSETSIGLVLTGSLCALKTQFNRFDYKYVLLNEKGICLYEYLYGTYGYGIQNRYLTINEALKKNCKMFLYLHLHNFIDILFLYRMVSCLVISRIATTIGTLRVHLFQISK